MMNRTIVWFSCGAASAVAAKLSAEMYDNVELVYCDTSRNEHQSNADFMTAVSKWVGLPVKIISSTKYNTIEEVAEHTRYMAGVNGARCTVELKKIPRYHFQDPYDTHVFGYTRDEQRRADRFAKNNHDVQLAWPLIEKGISKDDCYEMIKNAGIELPEMYKLGYKNNNCIGCYKATSAAYWNKIRRDFPAVFVARSKQSRELKVRLTRVNGERVFLDELPPDYMYGSPITEDLSCGPHCGIQMEFNFDGENNEQT